MSIKRQLDKLVAKYNTPDFIATDPISIPHRYTKRQDIEIAGLIAATFAWGQRKTIINKAIDFIDRMDSDPYHFVTTFEPSDLVRFQSFKHRTFNGEDAISLLFFLQGCYAKVESLESFFVDHPENPIYRGLCAFGDSFRTAPGTIRRSYKHVSFPRTNSACKRLNMYLRWMARKDDKGVDFGIWKNVNPADLIIPLDVHVLRSAQKLGLMNEEKPSWKTAVQLTRKLREMDPTDPIKYDFALFNLSIDSPVNN